nr:hypothetical protein CFP56_21298 [Quercus suber]
MVRGEPRRAAMLHSVRLKPNPDFRVGNSFKAPRRQFLVHFAITSLIYLASLISHSLPSRHSHSSPLLPRPHHLLLTDRSILHFFLHSRALNTTPALQQHGELHVPVVSAVLSPPSRIPSVPGIRDRHIRQLEQERQIGQEGFHPREDRGFANYWGQDLLQGASAHVRVARCANSTLVDQLLTQGQFVADGDWKYDHTGKTEADHEGNLNNVLYPTDLGPYTAQHNLSSVAPSAS